MNRKQPGQAVDFSLFLICQESRANLTAEMNEQHLKSNGFLLGKM